MSLLKQIFFFSILPGSIFGVLIFLVGWFGGVSLTKATADIPRLGLINFPFTNIVIESTKAFSIIYYVPGILYSILSIYQSRRSNKAQTRVNLVKLLIIAMLGGIFISLSSFIALLLVAYR